MERIYDHKQTKKKKTKITRVEKSTFFTKRNNFVNNFGGIINN